MPREWTQDWLDWIRENLNLGNNKPEMMDKLYENGFSPQSSIKKVYGGVRSEIPRDWLDWISENRGRGVSKRDLYRILLGQGFCPQRISKELDYSPFSNNEKRVSGNGDEMEVGEEFLRSYRDLGRVVLANSQRVETDKMKLYIIDDFLSPGLCDRLIRQIRRNHRPSTITSDNEPDKSFRTSQTCDFDMNDESVKETESQICQYMGIPNERSESIQGQYYQVGNEFKSHTDWFDPFHPKEWPEYGADRGQRTWTFMIYLNDVEDGGSTYFPKIDKRIFPKRGRAVAWLNIDERGMGNGDTLHWGTPIVKGEKFIITKWFRTRGNLKDPFKLYIGDQIPALTPLGYHRTRLSPQLFQSLRHFYETNRDKEKIEKDYAIGTFINTETDLPPTLLLPITSELDEALRGELLGQLEAWVGKKLEWTATYGIRTYQRGSHLKMHRDRYITHIVSGIINVAQKCDRDWPLVLIDNYGRSHEVFLQPGEVLFYESARCRHGRPSPFEGDSFSNIFFHTRPLYWEDWIQPYKKEVGEGRMLFE